MLDNNIIVEEKDYPWKEEQENILKKWGDKAICFKLMHDRSYKKYWCLNAWFNIPVIIISTVTGTGNFASSSIDNNHTFIFIIGSLNILGGILATIANYSGIAQRLEGHRFASISWDKFSRKIQLELSKVRNDRVHAKDFMKQISEEYDRLIEISPIIPNDIIRWFTNVIDTGEFDDELDELLLCFYDFCCFPCGCKICKCFNYCCKKKKIKSNTIIKNLIKDIEIPDIVGYIKPIKIAELEYNNKNSLEKSNVNSVNNMIQPQQISMQDS
jgi:hypothetical protein